MSSCHIKAMSFKQYIFQFIFCYNCPFYLWKECFINKLRHLTMWEKKNITVTNMLCGIYHNLTPTVKKPLRKVHPQELNSIIKHISKTKRKDHSLEGPSLHWLLKLGHLCLCKVDPSFTFTIHFPNKQLWSIKHPQYFA